MFVAAIATLVTIARTIVAVQVPTEDRLIVNPIALSALWLPTSEAAKESDSASQFEGHGPIACASVWSVRSCCHPNFITRFSDAQGVLQIIECILPAQACVGAEGTRPNIPDTLRRRRVYGQK
jgi:hypothetical protein